MTNPRWTTEQKRAIETVTNDVVVTASAGTGKTAVLANRCSQIIAKDSLADVSQILVLTFTEAAAAEMRSRISQQLKEEYLANRDEKLKLQLMMLDSANISTIHSFCKNIITEHFYALGIDPAFKIIDSDEQRLIKGDILEEIIEEAWQDSQLSGTLKELLYKRNSIDKLNSFLGNIISISDYLSSVADRDKWQNEVVGLYSDSSVIADVLAKEQRNYIVSTLGKLKQQAEYSLKLDNMLAAGNWWRDIQEIIDTIETYLALIKNGRFEDFAAAISGFEKGKLKNKPKGFDAAKKDLITNPIIAVKDRLVELKSLALLNSDYQLLTGGLASRQTLVLAELVRRFWLAYSQKKHQLNCYDFDDLQHLALKLLSDENGGQSEFAIELQKRYKFIFVDEYQDINTVQQRIFDLLAGDNNLFGVGDVKQSIYSFRQSNPEIFLDKIESASECPSNDTAAMRVDLSKNFRSRKEILDFANTIFGRIMQKEICSMDYDEAAMLENGFDYNDNDGRLIELHILDKQAEEKDNDAEKDEVVNPEKITAVGQQAMIVGKRIKQMIEQEKVEIFDKEEGLYRRADYNDVVILMRSRSNKINQYIEMLRLIGVPVSNAGSGGYFETTEITDCVSLLKVLDNSQQDIELAAVMRSPIFNFSDDELAKIHIEMKEKNLAGFYEKVKAYADCGLDGELPGKCAKLIEKLRQWRDLARKESLADLIWTILRQSGYLPFVTALDNGLQRRANLLKLHKRAIQFEGFLSSSQSISLGRFIGFIEKLLEQGGDWTPAESFDSSQQGVRIMSVHTSKGLEFPIVFLTQTDGKFNMRDVSSDCLVDSDLTLGLRVISPDTNTKSDSIAHQIIRAKKMRTLLAEEMRILYVALTRARERLIVTGTWKADKIRELLYSSGIESPDKPAVWQLEKCTNSLQWILHGLSDRKILHKHFETDLENENLVNDELFDLKVYNEEALKNIDSEIINAKVHCKNNPEKAGNTDIEIDTDSLDADLGWKYDYEVATNLAAKTSATVLTHSQDGNKLPTDEFTQVDYSEFKLESASNGNNAAEVGTATHLVLQTIDLHKPVNAESIKAVIDNLVCEQKFPESIKKHIDVAGIENFFASKLGREVIENPDSVMREWMFSYGIDSSEIDESYSGDIVIIQGVVDLLIKTDSKLTVIDFKTDNIAKGEIEKRAEKYSKQLEIYSRASSDILNVENVSSWLYFLKPGIAKQIN